MERGRYKSMIKMIAWKLSKLASVWAASENVRMYQKVRSCWESLILEPPLRGTVLAQGLVLQRALPIYQIQIKEHVNPSPIVGHS